MKKRNRYLLKPRDLVDFDGSVQDEGRSEAEDVSQQGVELKRRQKLTARKKSHRLSVSLLPRVIPVRAHQTKSVNDTADILFY